MTAPLVITLNNEEIPVRVRRNAQARRLILRVCPSSGEIRLTMPKRARSSVAQRFVEENLEWIATEYEKAGKSQPLGNGDSLSFLGIPRTLIYTGSVPRDIVLQADSLRVGGPVDMASGRLLRWLKEEARQRLTAASQRYASQLDVDFSRVSIGDMRSRWGSCSSRGTLRYSWRLVMAPEAVLNYVAAHEVAHLLELNHSSRFWAHVAACDPDYAVNRKALKKLGQQLFAVKI